MNNSDNMKTVRTLKSRAFRVGTYSFIAALIVIAIAVAVNLFTDAIPVKYTKFDTTGKGLFTLSEQSEKITASLTKDVTIYWLAQKGAEDATVESLIEKYADLSGKVNIVKKDPVVYPNFATAYTSEQITNNSLIVVCGERSRYVSYYDIFVSDYSNYYTTGNVTTSFDGESALTSAFDFVSSDNLPVLYRITGHGEGELETTLSSAIADENIELKSISLLAQGIPEDADCIMIFAPVKDISADEKQMILSYLEAGGKCLVVTDYTGEDMKNIKAVAESYGCTQSDGIVFEGNSNSYYQYPYWLLEQWGTHEITSPFAGGNYYAFVPAAQGITVADELRENLTVTPLVSTSDSAYVKLNPETMTTYEKEENDISGGFALGVAIDDGASGAKMVWFSSSQMFTSGADELVSGANTDAFLNSLGYLCERENSISIHAKTLDTEYLTVPASAGFAWTAVLVAIIPALVLGIGIAVAVKRSRK